MFIPLSNARTQFLAVIAANITDRDIELFNADEVFRYSHVLPAAKLLEPLATGCFPTKDFYDYQFVISELGGFPRQGKYSFWFKLYLSSLYIFSESMENNLGDDIGYYFSTLKAIVDERAVNAVTPFADLLEWLHEKGSWSIAGRDYWLLVAWLLCRRIDSQANHQQFTAAYQALLTKDRREELAKRIKYGDFNPSDWLVLESGIPLLYDLSRDDFHLVLSMHSGSE